MKTIRIFSALVILLTCGMLAAEEKPVVTLIPFSGEKVEAEEQHSFDDYFQDALFQTGAMQLVEREKLNKVLAEQALGQTGITDRQAVKVGKVLGAQKVVLGSLRKVGNEYVISAKIVRADSAAIEATATATASGSKNFKEAAQKLATDLTGQVAGKVEQSDEKINRKVLVLDFVNQNKMEAADYLSASIAEAMIDPLDKTGNFQTLNRDGGQETAKKLKIEKEKFFSEANATEIGKNGGAEVVVIGNFVAIGNKIQIQAKAVDVLTGRVKVSKSVNGKLDATIFDTIAQLCESMAAKMKSELPPISKREVIHLAGDRATYGGVLWRTAILPGWGHIYADQKRGYLYLGLFAGSAGAFTWSHFNFTAAQTDYQSAKTDFDGKYSAANQAMDLRAYLSYAFLGVVALIWTDAIIFGRGAVAPPTMAMLQDSSFTALGASGLTPQFGSYRRIEGGRSEEYTYVRFGYAF